MNKTYHTWLFLLTGLPGSPFICEAYKGGAMSIFSALKNIFQQMLKHLAFVL